jgi:hypothetical protein
MWSRLLHAQPPSRRTMDYISSGAHPLTSLAWVTLSGAYAPASIPLRVTGVRKPSLRNKAEVLDEDMLYIHVLILGIIIVRYGISNSEVLSNSLKG